MYGSPRCLFTGNMVSFRSHLHELRAREVALARDVEALTERVAMAFGGAPFAVMPIDGKGFGVVATRELFIGERLLAETPLLVVPMDVSGYDGQRNGEYEGIPSALLEAAVDALPADSRCKFFGLSQNSAYVTRSPAGIAQTNGIPHTHGSKTYGAIYYMASRFNHSCDANACFRWNRSLGGAVGGAVPPDGAGSGGQLTVHATKRIPAGTEITFNYAGFLAPREARRRYLLESFGFECTCAKCAVSGPALAESEARIAALGGTASLRASLRAWGALDALVVDEPSAVLGRLDARYALVEAECEDGLLAGTANVLARLFFEFCAAAASRLQAAAAATAARPASRDDEEGGNMGGRGASALRSRACEYGAAARAWAVRARELARHTAGEDSPAFAQFEAAVARWSYNSLLYLTCIHSSQYSTKFNRERRGGAFDGRLRIGIGSS